MVMATLAEMVKQGVTLWLTSFIRRARCCQLVRRHSALGYIALSVRQLSSIFFTDFWSHICAAGTLATPCKSS